MEAEFESAYQPLAGFSEAEDEVEDAPPGQHTIRVLPDQNRGNNFE